MIVPMRHVTLLSFLPDQERTLHELRELGVLHVTPVVVPDSEDLELIQARLAEAREVLDAVQAMQSVGVAPVNAPFETPVDEVITVVRDGIRSRKELTFRLEGLEREAELARPFGTVEPASLRALAGSGINIKVCQVAASGHVPSVEGAVVQVLREDKSTRTLAIVSQGEVDYPGCECPWPVRSLVAVERDLEEARGKVEQIDGRLRALTCYLDALRKRVIEIEDREQFLRVRDGMGGWERVSYLTGYCPAERVPILQEAASQHGWGLLIREPGLDEQTPTLLKTARWVQPIKAVFDILGILPGYREIDVSACFLLFFGLFFAMLVGDAGYGLVFLVLTLLVRRKMPMAPAYPFTLMAVMSVATIIWGVLTGTYFGLIKLPRLLHVLRIDWLTQEENLKLLCFVIGTAHLMIAHAWNGILNRRSLQALAQVGWVGVTLCMFYLSRYMVLFAPLPSFVWPLMGGSVVLIVLFMTPLKAMKEEWFNHAMLPLSLVSSFMDVISYIRLYAVGMASLALAMAFNEMASGFDPGVGGGIAAVVVLFLGHALNLVLATMGVMVHGVRLNALEFSSHIGLSWTGVAFRPFSRKVNPLEAN